MKKILIGVLFAAACMFFRSYSIREANALDITSAGKATNISGGSTGAVVYQSAANTTAFLTAGTTNQILLGGSSAPSWSGAPQLTSIGMVGATSTRIPFFNTSQNLATDANFKYSNSGRLDIDGGYTIFNQPGGSTVINAATVEVGNNNSAGSTYLQGNGGTVYIGNSTGSNFYINSSSTFTTTGVAQLFGTQTNDNAAARYIGEFINNTLASAQTPAATTAFVAISTITLTAGDWDINGTCELANGGTTAATDYGCAISSANTSRDAANANNICGESATEIVSVNSACGVGPRRVSLTGSTVYYLVAQLTYSTLGGATWTTNSTMQARRMR